ncbi:unnamed protein product, partial [Didymodactylos carnosus]
QQATVISDNVLDNCDKNEIKESKNLLTVNQTMSFSNSTPDLTSNDLNRSQLVPYTPTSPSYSNLLIENCCPQNINNKIITKRKKSKNKHLIPLAMTKINVVN